MSLIECNVRSIQQAYSSEDAFQRKQRIDIWLHDSLAAQYRSKHRLRTSVLHLFCIVPKISLDVPTDEPPFLHLMDGDYFDLTRSETSSL